MEGRCRLLDCFASGGGDRFADGGNLAVEEDDVKRSTGDCLDDEDDELRSYEQGSARIRLESAVEFMTWWKGSWLCKCDDPGCVDSGFAKSASSGLLSKDR